MTSAERHEARYQRRITKRRARLTELSNRFTEYDNVFGFTALVDGYKKVAAASKDKTSTQVWMSNLSVNARKEQVRLSEEAWESPGFNSFRIKERGKWRDIQSAHISEKGIQNSFSNNCFIPLVKPHLIYDNGASLSGKGTSFSLQRFSKHLRDHVRRHGVSGGIYFFDFKNYFANIDRTILMSKVEKLMFDKRMIDMYRLFSYSSSETGLGLGSQVSQISALFYPNSVDHYIKDVLGVKGYGRHMDDGYIIWHDIQGLKTIVRKFEKCCAEHGIVLNKKKCRIIRIHRNFRFLKVRFFITNSGRIVKRISKEASIRERRRLRKFRKFHELGLMTEQQIYLNFHSWVMAQNNGRNYHHLLNMIRFYNSLFVGFRKYTPYKVCCRKHKVVRYIASIA